MTSSFRFAALALLAATAPAVAQDVHLNELYVSHTGTDSQEFVELIGTPGLSLDNLYVLTVEGDGAAQGTLDRVVNLTGKVIPADGFFVIGTNAAANVDFALGASDLWENGTETFYLLSSTATIPTVGTVVTTGPGTTSIPTLGTVLDIVGIADGGYPATDAVFDGAPLTGPDGTFMPAGVFRDADYPRGWVTDNFLEFDLDAVQVPYAPRTPGAPNSPDNPWVRVTEWMSGGGGGGFCELSNTSTLAADLTGWSFDDDSDTAGTVDLSGLGTLAAGASGVLAADASATFDADWGLGGLVAIVGNNSAGLDADDQLNVYAPNGFRVDRLDYGATTVPGSYTADGFSAWSCGDAVGANDVLSWVGSIAGDAQGSVTSANGDVGSPGAFVAVASCGDWLDLGNAKAGSAGTPALVGKGTLVAGDPVALDESGASAGSVAYLVVGVANLSAPFKGGVLVPNPDLLVILVTDGAGAFALSAPWPAGFPAGFATYFQTWIADGGAPQGYSATNAWSATTP